MANKRSMSKKKWLETCGEIDELLSSGFKVRIKSREIVCTEEILGVRYIQCKSVTYDRSDFATPEALYKELDILCGWKTRSVVLQPRVVYASTYIPQKGDA